MLWFWLAWRVVFETWQFFDLPREARERGWRYFRASLLVQAAVIVGLFSPENILRVNGYITPETGLVMLASGVAGLHGAATLMHLGLDSASASTLRALPAYAAMSALPLLYVGLQA